MQGSSQLHVLRGRRAASAALTAFSVQRPGEPLQKVNGFGKDLEPPVIGLESLVALAFSPEPFGRRNRGVGELSIGTQNRIRRSLSGPQDAFQGPL